MRNQIYHNTKKILDSIKGVDVFLGEGKFLNLVIDLKQTPRSGKLVRIKKFGLELPCQSIYSHLLSMAFNGDIFLPCFKKKFTVTQTEFICRAIAFHDLSESIIGDVPMFTDKALAGSHYKSQKQKELEEKLANGLIANSLPAGIKSKFINTVRILEMNNSAINNFFLFLDKSEPIIAVWKYAYFYKKDIPIKKFIAAMADFFLGKNLLPYCFSGETKRAALFLQNKDNFLKYYYDGPDIFEQFKGKILTGKDLRKTIESEKLQFVKS